MKIPIRILRVAVKAVQLGVKLLLVHCVGLEGAARILGPTFGRRLSVGVRLPLRPLTPEKFSPLPAKTR